MHVDTSVRVPLYYFGKRLTKDYIIDMLVEDEVIVELKAIDAVLPIHEAQILSYLRLAKKRIGLLINFNQERLIDGYRRFING
jgi:GxxExxY protein